MAPVLCRHFQLPNLFDHVREVAEGDDQIAAALVRSGIDVSSLPEPGLRQYGVGRCSGRKRCGGQEASRCREVPKDEEEAVCVISPLDPGV
jgi:hypothetical protein